MCCNSEFCNRLFKKQKAKSGAKWTSITLGRYCCWIYLRIYAPQFFLIYINNLSHDLSSNVKLFADDKSMFPIVYDQSNFIKKLEADLENIRNFLNRWKVSFNPDPSKQVQDAGNCKVLFNCKVLKVAHPKLTFDSKKMSQILSQ